MASKLRTSLIVASVVASLVAMSFGRELYNNYQVDSEINKLKAKTEALNQERFSIARLKDQLQSQDFLEGEARLKLGLKKPGEAAIIVPESERKLAPISVTMQTEAEQSTPRLWWHYFFHE